jgi:hypothetical protein
MLACSVISTLPSRPRGLLSLENIFDERHLSFRVEAVRLGVFFGVFSGGYKAILCLLRNATGSDAPIHAFLAGGVASLSLAALNPEM